MLFTLIVWPRLVVRRERLQKAQGPARFILQRNFFFFNLSLLDQSPERLIQAMTIQVKRDSK